MSLLPTLPKRGWLALPTLAGALALSWALNRPGPEVVEVDPVTTPVPMQRDSIPPTVAAAPITGMTPPPPSGAVVDIFAVRGWEPPPPVVDTTPPPPQAPPLPFKFLGRIKEPDKKAAFMLADGAQVVVVRVGDAIGASYRVEKYEAGQLLIRYRPMNLRQTLAVGDPP
jgi:hypothetical protein